MICQNILFLVIIIFQYKSGSTNKLIAGLLLEGGDAQRRWKVQDYSLVNWEKYRRKSFKTSIKIL